MLYESKHPLLNKIIIMSVMPSDNKNNGIVLVKGDIEEFLSEEEQEAFRRARSLVQTHCVLLVFI
jgi:hypothetical protein